MESKVEQRQYRKTALITASQWFKFGDHPAVGHVRPPGDAPTYYAIETLEGEHIVTPGDWIATGVQGEHWPIKPDIFAATYELAEASLTGGWEDAIEAAAKVADHWESRVVARQIRALTAPPASVETGK